MDSATRRGVEGAAQGQGGVISRRQLAALGVDRDAVAREVRAGRWAGHGAATLAVHRGPLPQEALRWRAVWEVGHAVAVLDGVSSLLAAGLTGFEEGMLHVSVTRNSRCPAVDGVRIHRVRRVADEHRTPGSVPRTPAAVAAVRGAGWAVSDRQAALVLAMSVQQRLVTGPQLVSAVRAVRTRGRRPFIRQIVHDIVAGAQSLLELDFMALARAWGLPEPERQVVRHGPRGRVYLDVRWAGSRLVVEIDGSGHRMGLAVSSDNLRQNEVTLGNNRVLRFDLLALRLCENEVMLQVRRGLGDRV
ncbi:MAG: hypothetical protein ABIQ61_10860 [Ornithinibacter sp.]